jgi:NAD(P)-dependent dehydrogenase (short-subunit alcohol dehydrogenase family)
MAGSLLVVVGSGPGIGVATASLFVAKGFRSVALISRNAERLKTDTATVKKANPNAKVEAYAANTGDHAMLLNVLQQVERELGAPEVVLFNAARIAPTTVGEEPVESVLDDFKNMNLGLYVTATWAKPHLEAQAKEGAAHPCLFLSGSGIGDIPLPVLFSLSMQKAAQQNLMRSLGQVLGPRGVHVAYASIDGQVTDDDPHLNAKNIASKYWELYQEKQKEWRDRVVIGDQAEVNQP